MIPDRHALHNCSFFNFVSPLQYFGWQSEGTSSQRCFAGKTNKNQLQPSGLALLILLPGALLQIDLLVRIGEICWMAAAGWLGFNLLYAIRQKPLPNDQ